MFAVRDFSPLGQIDEVWPIVRLTVLLRHMHRAPSFPMVKCYRRNIVIVYKPDVFTGENIELLRRLLAAYVVNEFRKT